MCGIVGFYTKTPKYKTNRDWLTQAIYCDALRGGHGTGIALVKENKSIDVYKRALHAFDFLDMRATEAVLGGMGTTKCAIGHNRMKTHGEQINAHTHPFQHGPITLVHNGTIFTHKLPGTHAVDSEQIAHALSIMPVEEVIPKLDGAFALVWWDERQDAMFITRNKERPLWIGKDKDSETIYFASEAPMLRWLCWRNNIALENMYEPEPGQLLKFTGGNTVPEISHVELYTQPVTQVPANPKNFGNSGWIEHKVLKDNDLHIGQKVIVSPISWSPHTPGISVNRRTYGEMLFMSSDYKCVFKFTAAQYMEFDGSKSYEAHVCGSSSVAGEEDMALVNRFAPYGENEFGLTSDEVYLLQATSKQERKEAIDKAKKAASAANENAPPEHIPGPDNKLITLSEYSKLIRHGCCMCSCDLDIKDAPHEFDLWGNVYCEDCASDPVIFTKNMRH